MPEFVYRVAVPSDVPALARIRAAEWESEQYWLQRITGYLEGKLHPKGALAQRAVFVALENGVTVGFAAGHLTRRFDCDGELEWIDVVRSRRRQGIGSEMVRALAGWFLHHGARRICVDPGNSSARHFYAQLGAENLNQHWMLWPDISILVAPTSAEASSSEC